MKANDPELKKMIKELLINYFSKEFYDYIWACFVCEGMCVAYKMVLDGSMTKEMMEKFVEETSNDEFKE